MKYTEPASVSCDDYFDDDGNAIFGFTTVEVAAGSTFGEAVRQLVLKSTDRAEWTMRQLLMTTRDHWSGYSEYTITNTWSEIILTVPAWNWEQEWPSLGDFLRAMADANPEADR